MQTQSEHADKELADKNPRLGWNSGFSRILVLSNYLHKITEHLKIKPYMKVL